MKKAISFALSLAFLFCCISVPAHATEFSQEEPSITQTISFENKVSDELLNTMITMKESEMLPVQLWLEELSVVEIEQEAWQVIAPLFNVSSNFSAFENGLATDIAREDLNSLIQTFIETKRAIMRKVYTAYNSAIIAELGIKDNVLFVSEYAPLIITTMTKENIEATVNTTDILHIDIYSDEEPNYDIASQSDATGDGTDVDDHKKFLNIEAFDSEDDGRNASDAFGVSGSGIKIGILENDSPDLTNSAFSGVSVTCSSPYIADDDTHGTYVTAICAAMAPNAQYYCTNHRDFTYAYE